MKIKPLKNLVLLKPLKQGEEKKIPSGIILAGENKEDNMNGEVVAVGDDVSKDIKIGIRVVFSLSTSTIKNTVDTYYIVREEDILAVIK